MTADVPRREAEAFIAAQRPVELDLARRMVRRSVVVGPVLVVAFGLFRGVPGAVAALLGVAIVAGYYLLTGLILSRAARVSLSVYHGAALFGYVLRLVLIAGTMLALAKLMRIDRVALGVSVVVAYLSLLLGEVAAITADRKGTTR